MIEFRGRTQSLAAWSREVGIAKATLEDRFKRGWTKERALTERPRFGAERRPRTRTWNGRRVAPPPHVSSTQE